MWTVLTIVVVAVVISALVRHGGKRSLRDPKKPPDQSRASRLPPNS